MTAVAVDARGFIRCTTCGIRFKTNHSCRKARGSLVTRRPPGFAELVEEAAAQARAEAAGEQLALDEVTPPCGTCGRVDRHVDVDTGDCVPCMVARAREQATSEEVPAGDAVADRGPP